jgi:hypothetical protein
MKRAPAALLCAALMASCSDVPLPTGAVDDPAFSKGSKGVWTVNTLDDVATSTCTPSHCTLRAALRAASAGERIVFKNNVAGTIKLEAGQLVVRQDVTIEGPGADRLTIDAGGASRVLLIMDEASAVISGVTVTGGATSGSGSGGGIGLDFNTSLELRDSRVVGNSAQSAGGGIANFGTLHVVNSTVSGNYAANPVSGGGGIFNFDGRLMTVVGSTIAGNEAHTNGGGIYNRGTATMSRTTVSGNTAPHGGGIFNTGSLTVRSSTIAINVSTSTFAGGIVSTPGTVTLANSIVVGNSGQFNPEWNCEASVVSFGFNLTSSGGGCPTNAVGDVVVLAAQLFTHVLEATLSLNGGSTATHALIERGRAVDAGYCPGETTDQRGFGRPFDDPTMPNALDGCDIGAFEWRPVSASGPGKGPKK